MAELCVFNVEAFGSRPIFARRLFVELLDFLIVDSGHILRTKEGDQVALDTNDVIRIDLAP